MLKRKDPNQTFPDKICGWCEKTMVRVKQCNQEWQKIRACSPRCGRLLNTHGCSEKEYEQDVIVKRCGLKTCNKPLYKRDGEPFGNWKRRKFCDKSCAAASNAHKTKPIVITVEAKVHAKCYVKGTPEFNAIAQLYGG